MEWHAGKCRGGPGDVEGELEQCQKSNVMLRRRAEAAELRLAQAGLLTAEASVASLSAVQVLQIQYGGRRCLYHLCHNHLLNCSSHVVR